ncbi:MAG: DoxX family protein [Verrucomicrobia bacterium]|jgi:putative oxidoreductase|nr:DoxX family protein [Verrucomicrobiota bacterium]
MIKKLFAPGNDSPCTNLALLVLRAWLGVAMLANHGFDKLTTFGEKSASFPDPLGVGHAMSLALVVFAEFFCSLLLVVGWLTRFGAFVLVINMAVAFFIVHKGGLSGEHSGELAFIYLAGYVVLLIAGPGRFSADGSLFKKKECPTN